jgi:hypothetical protein
LKYNNRGLTRRTQKIKSAQTHYVQENKEKVSKKTDICITVAI